MFASVLLMSLVLAQPSDPIDIVIALNAQGQTQAPPQRPVNPVRVTSAEVNQLRRLFANRQLIVNHSFRVNLLECRGTCLFVPVANDGRLELHLVKNNQIIQTLPQSTTFTPASWRLFEVKAVSFVQLSFAGANQDGIIVIAEHATGVGAGGARPFSVTRLYQRTPREGGGLRFQLLEDESRTLTDRGVRTIAQAETILRQEMNFLP